MVPVLNVDSPVVSSVTFTPNETFEVDGVDMSPQQAQQKLGPDVMKQLLNPKLYSQIMKKAFDSKGELISPPEYEPDDRRDYDYDR